MRNLKHSIVAFLAVAMISSLAVSQAKDFEKQTGEPALLSGGAVKNTLNVTDNQNQEDAAAAAPDPTEETISFDTEEALSEHMIEEITAEKSNPQSEYVLLAYGTLSVRVAPSEEAEIIDEIDAETPVQIFESTGDWYKIAYGQGQTGYVPKSATTESKEEAEEAAKHYDNFKKATVTTNSMPIRVRLGASTDSDIITELDKGTEVIVQGQEGDFIKVYYGSDYKEGYIAATALTIIPDSWIPKTEVQQAIDKIAEEKAAAERAAAQKEAEERAAAQKEAAQKATFATSSKSSKSSSSDTASEASSSSSSNKGQAIVNEAKKYLGVKYVWGGTSPKGFDCSGLVQYVCNKLGISVSRTSAAQATNGKAVSKSNLQPGDLVFFASGGRVHHVGIYIGNGQMIHAPQTGDVVKISSIETPYRQKQYAGARRVY